MKGDTMSDQNEGSNNSGEGQNQDNNSNSSTLTVEELQAQLEAERKSKERILEESKKYKEGYQQFKSKADEAEKRKAAEEEERLKKQGNFETLLSQREQRIKDLEESLDKTKNEVKTRDDAIVNFKKAAAFERALGGKLRKESYWTHVDFGKIAINPNDGSIDSQSLKGAVDTFLKDHKELVNFGNNANLPNHTGAGGSGGKLTKEQWKKLPLAERKKRMKDVIQ